MATFVAIVAKLYAPPGVQISSSVLVSVVSLPNLLMMEYWPIPAAATPKFDSAAFPKV
jgi:hypothetical protein